MTRDDLIKVVESALTVLSSVYRESAAKSDLYEAALMTVAVGATQAAGGMCLLTDDGRNPSQELTFRRSPGNLWLGQFSHVRASFVNPGRALEIHLGVYVMSGSRVQHECDVAILDSVEAERSRQGRIHPRHSKLITSIEAKCYGASP
ncbi:hypothetical protein [Fodinicola acaciae]|uniref:hypothetical protein n=1 Tax=Fodinicola acaciae TaxID=2681555 RepID=UPI0013D6B0D4|nr:hypothetical protein [Fodinicola acaciae]